MQDDGNLVLYGGDGNMVWETDTNLNGAYMQLYEEVGATQDNLCSLTTASSYTYDFTDGSSICDDDEADSVVFLKGNKGTIIVFWETSSPDKSDDYYKVELLSDFYHSITISSWHVDTSNSYLTGIWYPNGNGDLLGKVSSISVFFPNDQELLKSDSEDTKYLYSDSGVFWLKCQSDGNLVLYWSGSAGSIWKSNTNGQGTAPYTLDLQTDNNLVMHDSTNTAIWSSGTSLMGVGGAYLQKNHFHKHF